MRALPTAGARGGECTTGRFNKMDRDNRFKRRNVLACQLQAGLSARRRATEHASAIVSTGGCARGDSMESVGKSCREVHGYEERCRGYPKKSKIFMIFHIKGAKS